MVNPVTPPASALSLVVLLRERCPSPLGIAVSEISGFW